MLPPHFSEHRCPEKFVLSRLALKLMGRASSQWEPNIVHNWVFQSNSIFFNYYFPPQTSLWRVLDELECCHDGGTCN